LSPKRLISRCRFLVRRWIGGFFGQLVVGFDFFKRAMDPGEPVDPALVDSNFFEEGLSRFLFVPESGLGGFSFQLFYFALATFQVKETSEAVRGVLSGFSGLGGHQRSLAFTSWRR
jgi:hypothetical protein